MKKKRKRKRRMRILESQSVRWSAFITSLQKKLTSNIERGGSAEDRIENDEEADEDEDEQALDDEEEAVYLSGFSSGMEVSRSTSLWAKKVRSSNNSAFFSKKDNAHIRMVLA